MLQSIMQYTECYTPYCPKIRQFNLFYFLYYYFIAFFVQIMYKYTSGDPKRREKLEKMIRKERVLLHNFLNNNNKICLKIVTYFGYV